MKIPHSKSLKETLAQACSLAAQGDSAGASVQFQACLQAYLDKGLPLRALAAAKAARTALGDSPKVQAMLARIYTALGLLGDAQKEYRLGTAIISQEAIPLLRGLDRAAVLDILDCVEIVPVRKGTWVLRQGEKGEDIYLVAAGQYEVVRDRETLAVMHTGDIFGEIGFFHHGARSASVRALSDGELIRLPAVPLRALCRAYPDIAHALEQIYTARVIKKATEDLALHTTDLSGISEVHFRKGQAIDALYGITIIKHGVVEVDYDDQGLTRKRFLGPGTVFKRAGGRARANTDVDIIQAQPDITGLQEGL